MRQRLEYEVRHVEHGRLEELLQHMARHGWRLHSILAATSYDVKCIFERERSAQHLTKKIAIKFYPGETDMNDVTLLVGQSTTGTIVPLEADGVTVTPGATVSHASFSLSDPSVSVVDNGDGTVTITGVAPSTGPVSGTAQANVADQDGATGTFTQAFTVTVNPAPTGLTASIGVDFSTPA